MASIIAHNIITPLGFTSEENFNAIKQGRSSLVQHEVSDAIPFAFCASLFDDEQVKLISIKGHTRFESLAIRSIKVALSQCDISLDSDTILILSTTKGNVDLLLSDPDSNESTLGLALERISSAIGLKSKAIAVSNACISGVNALILGNRLIKSGRFKNAIICGADVQSPFIIAGFQSLKALSPFPCRPFDIERLGLNLGEGAATIILSDSGEDWHVSSGTIRNDAYHTSTPSPKGDGLLAAIETILEEFPIEHLGQINAHGTATMYNDQMESKGISRAALSDVPMNAFKGYFGHTMGAAGVIEVILSTISADHKEVIATKGFEEIGVSGKVNISNENVATLNLPVLKLISGFGGCNAALLLSKDEVNVPSSSSQYRAERTVRITPSGFWIDGNKGITDKSGKELITELYKKFVADYPKFYKMDMLSRLGFIASELLLKGECETAEVSADNCAVILFNSNASINVDREYVKTISNPEEFFPSPSLFVYTLPNMVNGEIAIRNHFTLETAFYVLPHRDELMMKDVVEATLCDGKIEKAIIGWVEYNEPNDFEAELKLIIRNK